MSKKINTLYVILSIILALSVILNVFGFKTPDEDFQEFKTTTKEKLDCIEKKLETVEKANTITETKEEYFDKKFDKIDTKLDELGKLISARIPEFTPENYFGLGYYNEKE